MLQGTFGSGKMSLAEALLARASLEHAHVVVIDHRELRFDPWVTDLLGANLDVLTAAAAGEDLPLSLVRNWALEPGDG